MNRTFWDNVLGGIITGVVVAALIAIFSMFKGYSIYHLVMGNHLVWDWGGSKSAVAANNDTDRDHSPDRELGKHDVCILSKFNIQKIANGAGECSLDQGSEHVWHVHAKVLPGGNDGQH